MWEDGFCQGRGSGCLEDIDGEDPVRKAFSKMSIQLYNYGEGWVLGRCFVMLWFCSLSLSFFLYHFLFSLSLFVNLVQYPIPCGGTRELSYLCTSEQCSDWVGIGFWEQVDGESCI